MGNWAGEHAINFILDILAGLLAAWFITKYKPRLSDYVARRSRKTLIMHISDLEHTLDEYNARLKDIPSFVGRLCFLLGQCLVAIILFGIFLTNGSLLGGTIRIMEGLPSPPPMHPTHDFVLLVAQGILFFGILCPLLRWLASIIAGVGPCPLSINI
jgi:hypothetical protein